MLQIGRGVQRVPAGAREQHEDTERNVTHQLRGDGPRHKEAAQPFGGDGAHGGDAARVDARLRPLLDELHRHAKQGGERVAHRRGERDHQQAGH